MIRTIFTAFITYVSTSVDEIPVLFLFYMKGRKEGRGKTIALAYMLGTFLLLTVSAACAIGLGRVPDKWLVGFIGLVPLVMGIWILLSGEDDEEEKALRFGEKHSSIWLQVLTVTIALGADDLGLYIPLFTTMTMGEVILMLMIGTFGSVLFCVIAGSLTRIDKVKMLAERFERYISGTVFAAAGIWVLWDCGTIHRIYDYLKAM